MRLLGRLAVASAIALVLTLAVNRSPLSPWLAGLSEDLLFLMRHELGLEPPTGRSAAVVIAIDEETYERPPFEDTPKVVWTPYLGEVMKAALDHGATVIGQDLILPTSLEEKLPGIDRPYFAALAQGGAQGRVVLGAVRHQGQSIEPHPRYQLLARGGANLRLLNLRTDPDGVIREASVDFPTADGGSVKSFAGELALRATAAPEFPDHPFPVNFRGDPQAIPVYSLADIHACARAGNAAFLEEAFRDRVVLIGAVLDIEDRKTTALRYLSKRDGEMFAPRCVHPVMQEIYGEGVGRNSIPGVMIHAQVVNDLLLGPRLTRLPELAVPAGVFLVALLGVLSVLALPASAARYALGAVGLGSFAGGLGLFLAGIVTPFLQAVLAAILSGGAGYGYRFAVTDRDKRRLHQSFARYLSPQVVAELAETGEMPRLGGEMREVTIWFSDLANFTKLSESLTPEQLVTAMNEYLSVVTDEIVSHRGMIDKFIGDAVVGVFGAPLNDRDHARHALEALLSCQKRLDAFAATHKVAGHPWPHTRIGIHTGPVLVGNIGSEQRLNYTVMGDSVNLAARLESLNKQYGSTVLISGAAYDRAEMPEFRKIDRVRVVGKSVPTDLYSLMPDLPESDRKAFEAARAAMEAGAFAEAARGFAGIAALDPVAARLAGFAGALAEAPPQDWDGARNLDKK